MKSFFAKYGEWIAGGLGIVVFIAAMVCYVLDEAGLLNW